MDLNGLACETAAAIFSTCESAVPSFTALAVTAQAQCVCYDSNGIYDPTVFDEAANSCYSYLLTASPTDAPDYSSQVIGLCTNYAGSAASTTIGDFNQGTTTTAAGVIGPGTGTGTAPASTGGVFGVGTGTTPTATEGVSGQGTGTTPSATTGAAASTTTKAAAPVSLDSSWMVSLGLLGSVVVEH